MCAHYGRNVVQWGPWGSGVTSLCSISCWTSRSRGFDSALDAIHRVRTPTPVAGGRLLRCFHGVVASLFNFFGLLVVSFLLQFRRNPLDVLLFFSLPVRTAALAIFCLLCDCLRWDCSCFDFLLTFASALVNPFARTCNYRFRIGLACGVYCKVPVSSYLCRIVIISYVLKLDSFPDIGEEPVRSFVCFLPLFLPHVYYPLP